MHRRVPFLKQPKTAGEKRFNHSLVRTVLLGLLLASLFPVMLIGSLTYFRSRDLLRNQTARQMESMVSKEVDLLKNFVDTRENLLEQMATDPVFNANLATLLSTDSQAAEYSQSRSKMFLQLKFYFEYRAGTLGSSSGFFDELFIVRQDGSLLVATNDTWVAQNVGTTQRINRPFLLNLIGTNNTIIFNDPEVMTTNHLVITSTRSFVNDQGEIMATMFAMGSTPLSNRMLTDAGGFFPNADAFFFTPNKIILGANTKESLQEKPYDPNLMLHINPVIHNEVSQTFFDAETQDNTDVLAFARWLPEYQVGLSVLVPQEVVYGQIRILDGFNILMLLLSLLLTSGMIYLGSTRLVSPLIRLSEAAERFSKGNWNERANIERSDEIGLLAHSFDAMANDLSDLYQSMEAVVEKRTSQLRIASEVAQLASSTSQISETLSRTVELVSERFGYYHVAIYLMDETGRSVTLSEASGPMSDQLKQHGERILVGSPTLIGWTAANNQARVIKDVQTDELYHAHTDLPDTQSEVSIPISINQQVLGILNIQSTLIDAFDKETVQVLQTLANQISTTLQNTRLLETTQVNYQETTLLYKATRLVTQAKNEDEIIQILSDSLVQLPYISSLLTVDGDNFKILMIADHKTEKVEKNLQSINIPVRDMAELLLEQRVVLVEDINQLSGFENLLSALLRRGCKSAALVGVVEGGRLTKVLTFGSRETDQITRASLQPYANLAEVIGASLEKFRVLGTLQQRLSELQILASFSDAISVETDLSQLYRVLLEQVMQTMGNDINFAVALYNQSKNMIEIPFRYENRENKSDLIAPFPLGEGLTSYLIQNRKPLLINSDLDKADLDKASRQFSAKLVGKPAKSWMGVPLIFGGEVVGALIIQDEENAGRFTQNDVNLFMTLAPQIATAIRNAQLITETQKALRAYDQEHFLLNTLLNNSPDGITFKDLNGRYIRASKSIAQIYQIEHERIEGSTDFDLFEREKASQIWNRQAAILESSQVQTEIMETRNPHTAEIEWWQVTGIPISDTKDQPYGLLILQRNITELKTTEALAQRRAEQVLTAAEIARDTTGTLEMKTLLQKSVNLVRERFGFYHASIFLIDALGEYAVLRESTGFAGEKMMQAGHRLAVGSKSIVGTVTAQNKALIVNNVTSDPNYYPNPLLPDTRSELAIPLMVGERILGALDVQHIQENAFNDEDVSILQILADQLAVAVANGDLFAKTQELLSKHRLLRQITISASTSTNLEEALLSVVRGLHTAMVCDRIAILMLNNRGELQTQASAGYEGTMHLEARVQLGQGITGLAAQEKRSVRIDNTANDPRYLSIDSEVRSELAIPILFSEELLGVLNLESKQISAFDENDQEILGALGNNLGGVIANLRLVQQVRQQVERERLLFDVTSKIRRSVDLETILETSTREICRALGARRARIQVTAGQNNSQPVPPDGSSPSEYTGSANRNSNGRSNGNSGSNGHHNGGSDYEQEADK